MYPVDLDFNLPHQTAKVPVDISHDMATEQLRFFVSDTMRRLLSTKEMRTHGDERRVKAGTRNPPTHSTSEGHTLYYMHKQLYYAHIYTRIRMYYKIPCFHIYVNTNIP
jgi:hypothetical protein